MRHGARGERREARGKRHEARGIRQVAPWLRAVAPAVLMSVLAFGAGAQQQPRNPELGYAYPAGGQQGAELEITVGGQALFGAETVFVSGTGVTARVLGYKRPLTIGEANNLRERIEEAYKKITGRPRAPGLRFGNLMALRDAAREAGITDEQLRALEEFRRLRTDPKRQPNPQLDETLKLQVAIAPDAEPGMREIRMRSPLGLTNPVRFFVGSLPEVAEVEPNDRLPDSCIGDAMPVVVNGQIMPGDVDRFSFTARKGMRLVVSVAAREIVPYLADAVPGWFQAVVAVYDRDGKELAYADDFRQNPDPALVVEIPKDGEYTLEVRDSIYRGREDFVYRVSLGELPFVTGVFPLGVRVGHPAKLVLSGWNLPGSPPSPLPPPTKGAGVTAANGPRAAQGAGVTAANGPRAPQGAGVTAASVSVNAASVGLMPIRVPGAVGPAPVVVVDDLAEAMEKEPNDQPAQAQRVAAPVAVNGRIGRPGDTDLYVIQGRKGAQVVIETQARRLGAPTDTAIALLDSKGRRIAFSDDWEDKGAGLVTHQADSFLMVQLPSDGVYTIRVSETQGRGGSEFAYRLRISPPKPDFELRVTPAGVGMRAGTSVPLTVFVLRRDGFSGEIKLALKDAPPGFVLSGGRIPAGADKARITLTAAPRDPIEPVRLSLEGTATIAGRTVTRTAVPAQDAMQAFAYRHLVPAQDWLVAVAGRYWPAPISAPADTRVKVPAGGTVRVQVPRVGGPMARQVALELSDPPEGITLDSFDMRLTGGTIVLKADAKAKPGTRGNLIVDAFMVRQPGLGAGQRQAAARRVPIGCLPAIPFEITSR